jgi:peptide/nickel transport system substrate-binding protein
LLHRYIGIAALAVVVASCTQTGGSRSSTAGIQSGTLRVAIQADVKNLNPLLNSNTTDGMIDFLMFEPLLHANPQGQPVPMLAAAVPTTTNGGISKDGLTITYHLRRNVRWTDGVPVTSKDVKWSWQALMNPDNNVISRHGYDYVRAVDIPDDYTVIVHLKKKFAPFVNTFFADSDQPYPVAPAHVLSKYPNVNQVPFNNDPSVSDGPFKFVRCVNGEHMEFTANNEFFMCKPGLKKVYVRVVPDENTTINLLRTHDIDWMVQASISNYPTVKTISGIKLVWVNINGYESAWLNTQRPYLQDVRVRQAIAYAIDKRRLIETLTFGTQTIATEDQPPFMWSHNPNVQPTYTPDIPKARALLQQAGWTPGAGGIMTKNGQPLTLVMVSNNSNATRRKSAVEQQEMLREAGIQLEVKYFPGDVLFAPAGEGGILQSGKFDIGLAGWYAGTDPDDASQLTCANVAPAGYNYSRYCSAQMDALQNTALSNYDQPVRKKAYFQIQDLLARDVPMIYYYYQRQMEPINENFKGFAPNPVTESWNAWQWSI